MSGICMPPTNPSRSDLLTSAASAPTRYEPSSSLNLRATSPAASSTTARPRIGPVILMDSSQSKPARGRAGEATPLEAFAAARLVEIGASDDHAPGLVQLAVGAIRRRPAHHADRQRLGD